MLKRILVLALFLALGVFGGAKVGQLVSYWFAPEIMRLYLSATEYWQRLPYLLTRDDPLGLTQTVVACSLTGSILGGILILTIYYYLNRNRKKI